MPSSEYYFEHREKVAIISAATVGSLCFATLITLTVMHIMGYLKSCCAKVCGKDKSTEEGIDIVKASPKLKHYKRRNRLLDRDKSRSLPNLGQMPEFASFKIPGHVIMKPIQPTDYNPDTEEDSRSDSPMSSASAGIDSPLLSRRRLMFRQSIPVVSERVQPRLKELKGSASFHNFDSLNDTDLDVGLYERNRRKTIGFGQLGKVVLYLSFHDQSRKRLDMILQSITKLQLLRQDYVNIAVKVLLYPEREVVYTTPLMFPSDTLDIRQPFSFMSKPNNRDFEARTLVLNVTATERSGRQIVNCQARLPLLNQEIYSQVRGSFSINLVRRPHVEETGDLYLQLSYSPEHETLTMMIKCVKFLTPSYLESLTGLRLKVYAKCYGSKLSRKRLSFHPITSSPIQLIDIDEQLSFKISKAQFLEASVKILLIGKHKILGKSVSLGRVRVGDAPAEEVAMIHWRHVFSQPGVASIVWHPVCLA